MSEFSVTALVSQDQKTAHSGLAELYPGISLGARKIAARFARWWGSRKARNGDPTRAKKKCQTYICWAALLFQQKMRPVNNWAVSNLLVDNLMANWKQATEMVDNIDHLMVENVNKQQYWLIMMIYHAVIRSRGSVSSRLCLAPCIERFEFSPQMRDTPVTRRVIAEIKCLCVTVTMVNHP